MPWSSVPSAARLVDALRARAFTPGRARAIGAEVEFVPVDRETRRPLPIGGGVRIARRAALRLGLAEYMGPYGVPNFATDGKGALTFEPGGQIEYSAPPFPSASALAANLREAHATLRDTADAAHVDLLSLGIDPCNAVECTSLQIGGSRYPAMDAYFRSIGPFGARMMRQTASFQVSLDRGEDPTAAWRLLNAAAPVIVALFANSSRYEGQDTGHRSFRAHVWRRLDPARTGVLSGGDDPAGEYGAFALRAPAILHVDPDGMYQPFGALLAQGIVNDHDWAVHLTTLFPEVRARGTFEVRSADAIPPEWYVVPLALLGGLAYDAAARAAASDLLGAPDPCRLVRAGQEGLADLREARAAAELVDIAVAGCRRLGPAFVDPGDLERVDEFRERYIPHG